MSRLLTVPPWGAQSSRFLTDASFLNIRNATFNYNIPNQFLSKLSIDRARVYVSGENLVLISARKGMDPNQAGINENQSFTGVTSNVYVPARILSFGLNFTL